MIAVTTKRVTSNSLGAKSSPTPGGAEGLLISVSDKGNGIPQNVVDKIFQPFFIAKPAGQVTGLGLSLSYDIIKKKHGGTIKVESKVDKGTTFIINLSVV